jgi:site-specific recombinase XerD
MPRLAARLRRRGVRKIEEISEAQLLQLAPRVARKDTYLAALVRSLARYLDSRGLLLVPPPTRSLLLVREYRDHLDHVRGLAASTMAGHASSILELLDLIQYDADPSALRRLTIQHVNAFLTAIAPRLCREALTGVVSHVRSFLRFLVERGEIAAGLENAIDTPRVYRGERLPRALPWKIVESFLSAIDRSSPKGRRDYAMFLLITTYGLRASEVAALRFDDIDWRAGRLCAPRPKLKTPILLPLSTEVGAAIADYVRRDRPALPHREVFLRLRSPIGGLGPAVVKAAFAAWVRRARLPIPYTGPHCLRHSLAVHLLRQGTTVKAIGDLLGHRSIEATSVYLRLAVEDLRDAALEVPPEARQ